MGSGRISDAFSLVFGAWGSRPTARRAFTVLALLMMLAGAGLLAYPTFTDFYSDRQQSRLATEFVSPQFKTQFSQGKIVPGQVLTRIEIPSIKVEALIVEGTDEVTLRAGAGHYSKTALPCEPGNVAIAGHRTTFGKPFDKLDQLKVGDKVKLVTPEKQCTYTVTVLDFERSKPRTNPRSAAWISPPENLSVLKSLPGSMLTLTTCHPRRSDSQRLILRAEMVRA